MNNSVPRPVRLSASWFKTLLLAAPFLVGCESALVDLELPASAVTAEPFSVSVTHDFEGSLSFGPEGSSPNDAFIFAAVVPEDWEAQSGATYMGSFGGSPMTVPATVVAGAPATSQAIVDEFYDGLPPDVILQCSSSVTLREGDTLDSPLIATLYSSSSPQSMAARDAGSLNLASYDGVDIYIVLDTRSCFNGPVGLVVDNLSLNAGAGNVIANPSFETGLTDWDLPPDCTYESLAGGATTAGAGEFVTPAAVDGGFVLATDANEPGTCVASQTVQLVEAAPGDLDAVSFTGAVGSNYIQLSEEDEGFYFFMDREIPPVPDGYKYLWFMTEGLAPFPDIQVGDGGTLELEFIASEVPEETVEVYFLHGIYLEIAEEIILPPDSAAARSSASGLRDRLSDVGDYVAGSWGGWSSAAAGSSMPQVALRAGDEAPARASAAPSSGGAVLAPAPGFLGSSTWFVEDAGGGLPSPAVISDIVEILGAGVDDGPAGAPREVPVMGGAMLLAMAVLLGLVGLRRRRHLRK